jgi:hypothetical protein
MVTRREATDHNYIIMRVIRMHEDTGSHRCITHSYRQRLRHKSSPYNAQRQRNSVHCACHAMGHGTFGWRPARSQHAGNHSLQSRKSSQTAVCMLAPMMATRHRDGSKFIVESARQRNSSVHFRCTCAVPGEWRLQPTTACESR